MLSPGHRHDALLYHLPLFFFFFLLRVVLQKLLVEGVGAPHLNPALCELVTPLATDADRSFKKCNFRNDILHAKSRAGMSILLRESWGNNPERRGSPRFAILRGPGG